VVAEALRPVLGDRAALRLHAGAVEVRPAAGLDPRAAGRLEARVEAVLRAHGWDTRIGDGGVSGQPATP
jgi:hypothetical protein